MAERKEHASNLEHEYDAAIGLNVHDEDEIQYNRDQISLMQQDHDIQVQRIMDLEAALRLKDEEMIRFMNDQNESRNVSPSLLLMLLTMLFVLIWLDVDVDRVNRVDVRVVVAAAALLLSSSSSFLMLLPF